MLARASRSLVSTRSAIADILIARTPEAKDAAFKDMKLSEGFFTKQMDTALAAAPGNERINSIKTSALAALSNDCGPVITEAVAAADEAAITRTQADFAAACKPAFTAVIADITDEIGKITALAETRQAALVETTRTTILIRSTPSRI